MFGGTGEVYFGIYGGADKADKWESMNAGFIDMRQYAIDYYYPSRSLNEDGTLSTTEVAKQVPESVLAPVTSQGLNGLRKEKLPVLPNHLVSYEAPETTYTNSPYTPLKTPELKGIGQNYQNIHSFVNVDIANRDVELYLVPFRSGATLTERSVVDHYSLKVIPKEAFVKVEYVTVDKDGTETVRDTVVQKVRLGDEVGVNEKKEYQGYMLSSVSDPKGLNTVTFNKDSNYFAKTFVPLTALDNSQAILDEGQTDLDALKTQITDPVFRVMYAYDEIANAKMALKESIDTATELGIEETTEDPEDKAVVDALREAQAVYDNPDATLEQINEAKQNLDAAIEAKLNADREDARARLQEAITAAEAKIAEGNWTPETLEALQAIVNQGKALLENPEATTEELNQKAVEVIQATNALVKQADKTGLNESIATAEELGLDETTEDPEDKAVVDALREAREVANDPNATQLEVDNAKAALDNAIRAKKAQDYEDARNAAKQALEEAIKRAEAKRDDGTPWTPESIEELNKEIEEAKALLENPDATIAELNEEAVKIPQDADKLVEQADKEKLNEAIEKAKDLNIDEDTTDPEDKEVLEALKKAQEVANDPNATQEEVDQAARELELAISKKEASDSEDAEKFARENLAEKIKEAKEKLNDGTVWDEETKKALEEAIKNGEELLANEDANIEDILKQAIEVEEKTDALEEVAVRIFTDEKTNVRVTVPKGAFTGEIYLHVELVTSQNKGIYTNRDLEVYEIYWTRDKEGLTQRIQPMLEVTVELPMRTTTNNDFRLEQVEDNGLLTPYEHIINLENRTVTFTSKDFSLYVLSSAKTTQPEKPTVPSKPVAPSKPVTKPSTNVKTGDIGIYGMVGILAIALAAFVIIDRQRKREVK